MIHSSIAEISGRMRALSKPETEARPRFILHQRLALARKLKKNAYRNKYTSKYGQFQKIAFVESLLHISPCFLGGALIYVLKNAIFSSPQLPLGHCC
jgi:hypothetical protein